MKEQVYKDPRPASHFDRFHERSRTRDPDWVYEAVRIVTTLYAWIFFRARGIATEKVPAEGPLILAPNHFSFMDHFFLGVSIRRKVRFMAKSQLFERPMQWVYTHGGVFPVRRGYADEEAFKTATSILARRRHDRDVQRGRPLAHRQAVGQGAAGHRPARAAVRRDDRAGRDPRLVARAQLEAAAVPEGHDPVRRPDPVGARRGPDARAAAGGRERDLRGGAGAVRRSSTPSGAAAWCAQRRELRRA